MTTLAKDAAFWDKIAPKYAQDPIKDMAAYDRFYKRLISEVSLTDVSSSFAMEEIKYTTALPLEAPSKR